MLRSLNNANQLILVVDDDPMKAYHCKGWLQLQRKLRCQDQRKRCRPTRWRTALEQLRVREVLGSKRLVTDSGILYVPQACR